jgi:hypothetical protein
VLVRRGEALLGWGIGVAVHAVIVFGPGRAPR